MPQRFVFWTCGQSSGWGRPTSVSTEPHGQPITPPDLRENLRSPVNSDVGRHEHQRL